MRQMLKSHDQMKYGDVARLDIKFHYRKQRRQTVVDSLALSFPSESVILRTKVAQVSNNQLIQQVYPTFTKIPILGASSGIIRLNHFIPYIAPFMGKRFTKRSTYLKLRDLDYFLYIFQRIISDELDNLEFVGPFRKSPLRTYPFSGESPSSVGRSGEKTIDILAADESRRHGKKRDTLQYISSWFNNAHIAQNIQIKTITERNFSVLVKHYDTGELVNLADTGYGCSQILPILVAGYHIPEFSKLIIEQPEIHLHPKAEAEVGTFLYDISKRNIQIFVETHSEHLLLRLQSYVAAKKLAASDINVFYVYSDKGSKICQILPIGEDGYFSKEWPRGFFPERLEEARNIAKLTSQN